VKHIERYGLIKSARPIWERPPSAPNINRYSNPGLANQVFGEEGRESIFQDEGESALKTVFNQVDSLGRPLEGDAEEMFESPEGQERLRQLMGAFTGDKQFMSPFPPSKDLMDNIEAYSSPKVNSYLDSSVRDYLSNHPTQAKEDYANMKAQLHYPVTPPLALPPKSVYSQ
jgi:hypothetical protein